MSWLPVVAVAVAVALGGCSGTDAASPVTVSAAQPKVAPDVTGAPVTTRVSVTPPPTVPPTTTNTIGRVNIVDWTDGASAVMVGEWTVRACEGGGPFMCVDRHSDPVGILELLTFPVDTIDVLREAPDIEDGFRTLASDFVGSTARDRAIGCSTDYRVEPIAPEPIVLAGTPAMRYGFVGTWADGSPSEYVLQHSAVIDDYMVGVTAIAYDPQGCLAPEGPVFDTPALEAFAPILTQLVADMVLPPLPPGS